MNVALAMKVEEPIKNAEAATDGQIVGYTGLEGFAELTWPSTMTVALEKTHRLHTIRLLLWDGLGRGRAQRDSRTYKYRLLTSTDHTIWQVIFDSSEYGSNGWHVFEFTEPLDVRYIRIHALWNSANPWFQVVEIEAHDSLPDPLTADVTLKRRIAPASNTAEIGDGFPLRTRLDGIVGGLEQLVKGNPYLNPEPFRGLIGQLRQQVRDVSVLEHGMDSIRNEIIQPVRRELEKSAKVGRISVWLGIVGGVLAIISLTVSIVQ